MALLSLLLALLSLLVPWPATLIVDSVIGDTPLPDWLARVFGAFPFADARHADLVYLSAFGVLIAVAYAVTDARLTLKSVSTTQGMVFSLASAVFAQLQRRSLTFHTRTPVGDSLTRITGDTWAVDTLASRLIITPLQTLLMVLGSAWVLFRVERELALIVFLIGPLTVAASAMLGTRIRETAHRQQENQASLQSHLQQALSSIQVIQGFGQEKRQTALFHQYADKAIHLQRRTVAFAGVNELSSGLVSASGAAVALWFAAQHVREGMITLGEMLLFVAYLQLVQFQLKSLSGIFSAVQQAGASLDRIATIFWNQPEVAEAPGAHSLPPLRGSVRLIGVTAGYNAESPVLRSVSLNISPGEVIALIGPSGAGKSTLASLLPRFLDPWSGSVHIDGFDLRNATLQSVRTAVAVVPQDPILMGGTIIENIAFGNPDATFGDVEAAARIAQADAFIREMPHGYLTAVGERGATLSGGQRQRIAIARALATRAPILVLDEPTSALDAEAEHAFVSALDALRGERTVLLIAHRMTTAAVADRIVVLKRGRIAAQGSPENMLGRKQLTRDREWTEDLSS